MPDFELPDATGKIGRSAEPHTSGPLLIMFYRGHWCLFCNLTLKAMQERHFEIVSSGATLVAISSQTPDDSLTTTEKHGLVFPVLSDSGNVVARAFGIVFRLNDGLKAGVFPAFNGDNSSELPLPATFLIGAGGIVLKSFVEVSTI
jgi:peroxiredoxin